MKLSPMLIAVLIGMAVGNLHALPGQIGLKPEDPVVWATHLKRSEAWITEKTAKAVPPSQAMIDMQWLPAVGLQLYGNCGAWPGSYYIKTYYEAREHGWVRPSPDVDPEHVSSVAFTYSLEYQPSFIGSAPSYIADVLKYYGTTTWEQRPESSGYEAPTESEWRNAAPNRMLDWHAVPLDSEDGRIAAKALIAEGDPIGTTWESTTANIDSYRGGDGEGISNDVLYAFVASGTRAGLGHAVTIIGYDDNKQYLVDGESRSGAWLIVNQWGTEWGVAAEAGGTKGFMWIAYPLLTAGIVFEDRIGYTPRDFFVYEVRADIPVYMDLDLVYGDPASPVVTMELFRVATMNDWNTTVVEDITDYHALLHDMWSWRLALWSVDSSNAGRALWPPVVASARVELEGHEPIEFTNLPLEGKHLTTKVVDQTPNIRQDDAFQFLLPATSGHGVWTDWNGDGIDDLVASRMISLSRGEEFHHPVFISDGRGHFELVDTGVPSVADITQVADFDGNGGPDILTYPGENPDCHFDLYLQDDVGAMIPRRRVLPDLCNANLSCADVDNSGSIDVLVTGGQYVGNEYVWESRVWLNDGFGRFNFTDITVEPLVAHYTVWADLDRDGWRDAIIDGRLYKNMEGVALSEVNALPATGNMVVAGDFTNDGNVDLALLASGQTLLLKNKGDFSFETAATLSGFVDFDSRPNTAFFGDFDNDGRADFVQEGIVAFSGGSFLRYPREVQFFRQLVDGTFDRPGLVFPPIASGILVGGDVDNDGDMDIFASGSKTIPYPEPAPTGPMPWDAALYENTLNVFAGASINTAPGVPTNLGASVISHANGDVNLSWSAASDQQTPAPGLGYRLRVGRTPGGNEVVSSNSEHLVEMLWLSPGKPGRMLRGLRAGDYYWSVRAVDQSHVAGPWSIEKSFTIGTPPVPGDGNHDHVLDIADRGRILRMVEGSIAVDPVAGDFDENGTVDSGDVLGIAPKLIGRAWIEGIIDDGGGTLQMPGFELMVPAGSFPSQGASLRVVETDNAPSMDSKASSSYRIYGLPTSYRKPLTLTIDVDPLWIGASDLSIALGERIFRRRTSKMETGWQHLSTAKLSNGRLRTILPAPQDNASRSARDIADLPPDMGGTDVVADWTLRLESTPTLWDITLPQAYEGLRPRITAALDNAYNKFHSAPYSFSYTRRTSWPMKVCFVALDADSDGGQVTSKWGDDYSYLEFNTKFLANPNGSGIDPSLECVIGHEFLHFVQSLYDPRSQLAKATIASRHYWVDEMTAAWAETLFTAASDYVPVVTSTNQNSPLKGLPQDNLDYALTFRTHIAHRGYGLAPLCKYLHQNYGGSFLSTMYENIYAGQEPITALSTSLYTGAPNNVVWWSTFVEDWVDPNKLFRFSGQRQDVGQDSEFPAFALEKHRIDLSDTKNHSSHIYPAVGGYGINGVVVQPLGPASPLLTEPGMTLMARLKTRPDSLLLNAAVITTGKPTVNFRSTILTTEIQRLDIPNLKGLANDNSYVALTLTDTGGVGIDYPDLDVVVLNSGTYTVPPFTAGAYQLGQVRWPAYEVAGTLEFEELGPIEEEKCGGYCNAIIAVAWPRSSTNYFLSLDCTMTSSSSYSETLGSYRYDYALGGAPSYKLFRRNPLYTSTYQETASSSPSFALQIDRTKNYQLYDVVLYVSAVRTTWDTSGEEDVLIDTVTEHYEVPLYSALFWMGGMNWQEPEETPFDPLAPPAP